MAAYIFLLFKKIYFSEICQTNYLNIYIVTKFAGLVELWPQMNDLKLFFFRLIGELCGGN